MEEKMSKTGKIFFAILAVQICAENIFAATTIGCALGCRVCQQRKCYMTGTTNTTGGGRPVCNTYRVDMKCNDGNFSCSYTCATPKACESPRNTDGAAFVNSTDMSNACQNNTTIVMPSHTGCPAGYFELTNCAIPAGGADSKGTYTHSYCYY
jgi:hypothetical protein